MNNIEQTTNTELIREFGTKLDSYIQILAEKLGVAAEYVYPLFVKQQAIEGWTSLCGLGLFWVVSIVALALTFKINKKENWKWESSLSFLSAMFSFAITLICFIWSIKLTPEIATKLFNPEYAAIKEIIQMVK